MISIFVLFMSLLMSSCIASILEIVQLNKRSVHLLEMTVVAEQIFEDLILFIDSYQLPKDFTTHRVHKETPLGHADLTIISREDELFLTIVLTLPQGVISRAYILNHALRG